MKNFIITAIILIAIAGVYAFTNPKVDFNIDPEIGIQFHRGSFSEALEIAKKEDKLIFLDIYATWCGPCKRLKAKTFSIKEVGDYYNKTFVNIALDGVKGEGLELVKKYNVTGYPTLLYINSKGEIVKGTSGFYNSSDFLTMGKSIKK